MIWIAGAFLALAIVCVVVAWRLFLKNDQSWAVAIWCGVGFGLIIGTAITLTGA